MPKEGIFCRVLKTGQLKAGDKFTYIPRTFRVLILTLSDRAFRGEYEDRSGKYINQELKSFLSQKLPNHTITNKIIPDEPEILQEHIQHAKTSETDVLITTGGTGIGTRDITPETVLPFIDKHLHGIMEMVRVKYGANNPNALLSRSIAGLSGKMLVYTLPGSSKAVKEYLEVILPTIKHSFFMVHDLDLHG
jgi:molybdenum cofactor synthesis domain-containing protein